MRDVAKSRENLILRSECNERLEECEGVKIIVSDALTHSAKAIAMPNPLTNLRHGAR